MGAVRNLIQTDFFHLVEEKTGKVWQNKDGSWTAIIAGGWWVATARTRQAAIKSVINHYYTETNWKK